MVVSELVTICVGANKARGKSSPRGAIGRRVGARVVADEKDFEGGIAARPSVERPSLIRGTCRTGVPIAGVSITAVLIDGDALGLPQRRPVRLDASPRCDVEMQYVLPHTQLRVQLDGRFISE